MDRSGAEAAVEAEWRDDVPQRGAATPRPRRVHAERHLPLGDRERFGALLLGLEPRLTAVALRITRDPEAARDAVQSAFEKALRHGARFRGQARVSTWLHRIVANESLMWLRAQRRRREVQTDVDASELAGLCDPAADPAARLLRRERRARLRAGLAQLAAEERDVVVCCALDGESYAAYGSRAGLHAGAVKSRAFRARRRLAALLA